MDRKEKIFQPLAIVMTVLAALLRLAPHPTNFSPIGSVALFGGARLRSWQAYLVPLLALAITDPIRSFMEGGYPAYSQGTVIVYGSFLISVFLGRRFLSNTNSPLRIAGVVFAGTYWSMFRIPWPRWKTSPARFVPGGFWSSLRR